MLSALSFATTSYHALLLKPKRGARPHVTFNMQPDAQHRTCDLTASCAIRDIVPFHCGPREGLALCAPLGLLCLYRKSVPQVCAYCDWLDRPARLARSEQFEKQLQADRLRAQRNAPIAFRSRGDRARVGGNT